MLRSVLVTASCLVFSINCVLADQTDNFFVSAVTTELQRKSIPINATAYAIVHCNPMIFIDKLNRDSFDSERFLKALADATENREHLLLYCRFEHPLKVSDELSQEVQQFLKEIAMKAGYAKVTATWQNNSQKWRIDYDSITDFEEAADAIEPMFEDDLVRVYPIRTRLSKFLNEGADCLVEVVRPVDGRMTVLSDELQESIRTGVKAVAPSEYGSLKYSIRSTESGRQSSSRLFSIMAPPNIQEHEKSPAFLLAEELGFKKIRMSDRPAGRAPERLLDKSLPSAALVSLTGEPVDLQKLLNGRPGLITFWGLACGPCRREAPHLSTLHEKYGDRFAVIAINAYGDERESVEKYVQEENLKHTILLDGKSVLEQFQVSAYPTTYWIDRNGNIVDYEIGMTSLERLEESVQELLDE